MKKLIQLLVFIAIYHCGANANEYKSIYEMASEKNLKDSSNQSVLGIEYDESKIKKTSRMKKANEKFLSGNAQNENDSYDKETESENKKDKINLNSVKDVHDKKWREFEEMNKYKKKKN